MLKLPTHRFTYILIALLFVASAGCDSNEDDNTTAPDVFPLEAFTLQTELFNQTLAPKQAAGLNFTAAALRVWPVSLVLSANLVIPVALTNSAIQTDPTADDGSWVWSSSVTASGVSAAYSLTGSRRDDGTDWSMRVTMNDPSSSTPLEDFELFTGRTTDNGASGSWELYYPVDGTSTNVLSASYEITSDTEKSITFTIPASAEVNAGDSVEYTESGDERTFDWQQVGSGVRHLVLWNGSDQSGSITATNFNGGVQACWDSNLSDTACPAKTMLP
ncbi:MAG: hypothetical protein R2834_22090 [Rhodothermales bacterium]